MSQLVTVVTMPNGHQITLWQPIDEVAASIREALRNADAEPLLFFANETGDSGVYLSVEALRQCVIGQGQGFTPTEMAIRQAVAQGAGPTPRH